MKRARGSSIAREFDKVTLGDARLDRRLVNIVNRVAEAPNESFPKLLQTESEREGLYRFFSNEDVPWTAIMSPHVEATIARCCEQAIVRIAHDTTSFSFEGEREGLARVAGNKKGFFAHVALATSGTEDRAPLGVLGLVPFVRRERPPKETKGERVVEIRRTKRKEKESDRWRALAAEVGSLLDGGVACIHVMDREADDYALFAELVDSGTRFVIRGKGDRRPRKNHRKNVQDTLNEVDAVVFRTVPLGARSKPTLNFTARGERMAALSIRATTIELRRPQYAQTDTAKLRLNVVQVFEPDPPHGEEPTCWTLYTTEPIATLEDQAAVVDHYRARWRIEEYFKAIKTGCAFEKRQLTSLDALIRALAMFIPIAWHLMLLRTLGRMESPHAASVMFDDLQLDVLRNLAPNYKLRRRPTIRDAMLAIADIGGHIPRNGEPGWLVLGRGFEDFLKAERVWRAALAHGAQKM
jgi:hypothetical protein